MDSRRHFLEKVSGLAGTLAVVPARVLGANERVRVGIIGVGDRGLELIHQVRACANAEIVALADIYTRNLERASKLLPEAQTSPDFRSLLADPSIDAVVIATPPHVHAEAFCEALDSGKHVYVEKTLANSVADAKRMREAFLSDSGAHVVQVGHQACSFGHAADAQQFLSQPARMGKITALAMRNFRNVPHGKLPWARPALLVPDANPQNIEWSAFAGETAPRQFDPHRFVHWRYFWEYSGGSVTENMSQQLAFWYKTLDLQVPESATMTGGIYLAEQTSERAPRETPDTVSVTLTQPEKMLVTWASGFGNNQLGVSEDLLGTAGTISRGNQVRYVPQKMNRPDGTEMLGRTPHTPHVHMQNFFDSIRSGRTPNGSFDVGFRVAIACQMAVESYRQGRTVRWDAAREEII
jgi:predicted dehydrogenase